VQLRTIVIMDVETITMVQTFIKTEVMATRRMWPETSINTISSKVSNADTRMDIISSCNTDIGLGTIIISLEQS